MNISDFPQVSKINCRKMASAWRNLKKKIPYVLDVMDLLEQNFCRDSNLRVKLMYESIKSDVLKPDFLNG